MKLKSFRIENYKSILDSGECIISALDNITILAGQNESGKSSILQALRDYHHDELSKEAIRIDNEVPKISCTYTVDADDLEKLFQELSSSVILPSSIEKFLNAMKEVTIVKSFDDLESPLSSFDTEIDEQLEKMRSKEVEKIQAKNSESDEESDENENEEEENEQEDIEDVNSEDFVWNIVYAFDQIKPVVIFFDDFCDLLPDKILISDLQAKNKDANGYQPVKNVETILGIDLAKLDKLPDWQRNRAETQYHKLITANFNEKWTQRVGENNNANIYIEFNQGRAAGSSYLNFYVETKDQEFLPPRQRSQGFRWFLSFYLHLKAESERNKSLIILFDEPGLFLHSRAQSDMVKVFEELGLKNQIVYSTHSPYLIDATKLHRIRLVLNTKKHGTTIEKITTAKVKNQKDALKPIIDAVGLEVAHNFSAAKKKNVILEGISDYHYLEAFRKLLEKSEEFAFVPAMGSPNVHLLMELCIGWGLDWLIVFDEKGVSKEYNKIKKFFFENNDDATKKKILKLTGFDGIEELFQDSDFDKLLPEIDFKPGQKKGEIISNNGGKELIARLFLEKINAGKIKKSNLSKETLKNFEVI
ncbi:MAG TPA: AAA family ATPase, partial [Flavisolibacter sp.]|nr:AAA family ATPase [Flavisolibacter sp.]